jgi:hypothetical protein
MAARGLENNNPGNIRKTAIKWQGEIEGKDKVFETFESMVMGYRALIKNCISHISSGHNTIDKLITKWAPPEDGNDTAIYIATVERAVGSSRFDSIATDDWFKLKKIAAAISKVENGVRANESEIDQAIEMIQGQKKKLK